MTYRFVTYVKNTDLHSVLCMSEADFVSRGKDALVIEMDDWEEWVWQTADTPEAAIAAHDVKMDAYHRNPNKDTY